ncbi:MAG: putative ORFan [Homavirus sp.]|uniref:Putative ORFan n=1 Tax=Homavirus sp. TaxID=2487769 RepID=A0A3G5A4E4_9VIRU|nr:MAG: putative ORFan [Homavirus sp.]
MYYSFIEFKTKHINTVDEYDTLIQHPEKDLDDKLFNCWVDKIYEDNHPNFEVDSCIIKDFPLHEHARLISRFVPCAYRYAWGADKEIVKLVYLLWNTYMLDDQGNSVKYGHHNKSNEFHKLIFESLYTLKTELLAMQNLTLDDIVKLYKIFPNKGGRYYNWHLLGCIPLLGDKGLPVLRNVITLPYDDAQDLLMFGLYQYEPNAFYTELKDILLHWHIYQNIQYETGTGMLSQLVEIIYKYQINNLDLLLDEDFSDVFKKDKTYIDKQLGYFTKKLNI